MNGKANQKIGQLVVHMKLVHVKQVNECIRAVSARCAIGKPTSLDQILLEKGLIGEKDCAKIQDALDLRLVFCTKCQAEHNLPKTSPGKTVKCRKCNSKFAMPANGERRGWEDLDDDTEDFEYADMKKARKLGRKSSGRAKKSSGRRKKSSGRASKEEPVVAVRRAQRSSETAIGFLSLFPVAAVLLVTWFQSSNGHMVFGTAGAALGFGLLAMAFASKKQFLAASGYGLAIFTGLVIAAVIGNTPGSGAVTLLGVDAHALLAPLIFTHVLLLVIAGRPLLKKGRSGIVAILFLIPTFYGLLFYAYGSFPGVEYGHSYAFSGSLSSVPWFLHPAAVTMLVVFPVSALVMFGVGSMRAMKRAPRRNLLRHSGLIVSMLLLTGFGLITGTLSGDIQSKELKQQIDQALVGRIDSHWTSPEADQVEAESGTAAAAVTENEAPPR